MIELKGTEKQVKYANDIRNCIIDMFNELSLVAIEDVNERWESYSQEKRDKFGSKENLIKKRQDRINKVKEDLLNIEEAKIIIENYKDLLTKDNWLKYRRLKEIAKKEDWDSIISTNIQRLQDKKRIEWMFE